MEFERGSAEHTKKIRQLAMEFGTLLKDRGYSVQETMDVFAAMILGQTKADPPSRLIFISTLSQLLQYLIDDESNTPVASA